MNLINLKQEALGDLLVSLTYYQGYSIYINGDIEDVTIQKVVLYIEANTDMDEKSKINSLVELGDYTTLLYILSTEMSLDIMFSTQDLLDEIRPQSAINSPTSSTLN